MATGTGFGKIILFGEHFVVHGCPAIALGISNKAVVEVKKSDKLDYTSNVMGTIPEFTLRAIRYVLSAMKISDNFHVYLKGDLPTAGGLGSSAAFCVGLARAFSEEYGLKLTNEQVNACAYEGEKAFHGNPSGVDNVMATYGGAIRFVRNKGFEQIKIGTPLNFVIAVTGISSPTSKMVASVAQFKEDDAGQFQNLHDQALDIVKRGQKALASGDLAVLGSLMNENHKLLQAVGVSIEKNDEIVVTALQAGALGAKLTGGGGGGCCIALAKDAENAKAIAAAIKKKGFEAFVTKVG